jgi:hypothetical protein
MVCLTLFLWSCQAVLMAAEEPSLTSPGWSQRGVYKYNKCLLHSLAGKGFEIVRGIISLGNAGKGRLAIPSAPR